MPAPLTQTGIINAAAVVLGSSERITNIESPKKLAVTAKAFWNLTIRTLLADHPWNFGIKRALLNAGPAPVWGYERSFAPPPDCVRILPSRIIDGCEFYYDGELEDGKILSDAEAPLAIRYISAETIDNVQAWRPTFAKAASYALAMDMAEDMTGSSGLSDKKAEEAQMWLKRAKRIDGLESQRGNRGAVTARSRWLGGMRTQFDRNAD